MTENNNSIFLTWLQMWMNTIIYILLSVNNFFETLLFMNIYQEKKIHMTKNSTKLCLLYKKKLNKISFPLTNVFSPASISYAMVFQQCNIWLFHLVSFVGVHSPFVKRGSGSFLKKDFSKLLITFKSRHF